MWAIGRDSKGESVYAFGAENMLGGSGSRQTPNGLFTPPPAERNPYFSDSVQIPKPTEANISSTPPANAISKTGAGNSTPVAKRTLWDSKIPSLHFDDKPLAPVAWLKDSANTRPISSNTPPLPEYFSIIGIDNREKLRGALQITFDYDWQHADDVATVWDTVAHNWAAEHNRPVSDWYKEYLAGISRGGDDLALRLGGTGTEEGVTYPARRTFDGNRSKLPPTDILPR
ncbi:MAG: hypothetical protein EOP06_27310 [Proteobacteria bacterium]|nr:MAG: hypothetical protein EOP06_27310 [Pseudomonadota bacterium]